jgi:DNA-binding FadR family transcriptional regulator
MEVETARLAALRRTEENLAQFQQLLQKETLLSLDDIDALTEVDFEFHLLVGISSGNLLYPLMINSVKGVYTTITKKFFSLWVNAPKLKEVFNFHQELTAAIAAKESQSAAEIMTQMLKHGEKYLKGEA